MFLLFSLLAPLALVIFRPALGATAFVLLIMAVVLIWNRRHPDIIISEERPAENPRELVRMDSWQTVVIALGEYATTVRDRMLGELRDGIHPDVRIREEDIAYLGVYGKVERRQIAVTFRRALAFVEVHPYGDDLYVDWEAYLNLGVWAEAKGATELASSKLQVVRYKHLAPELSKLNEYDISDANFLIEWVHACLTKTLRRVLKEREVDQEIDFKILRADRRDVFSEGQERAKKRFFARTD